MYFLIIYLNISIVTDYALDKNTTCSFALASTSLNAPGWKEH